MSRTRRTPRPLVGALLLTFWGFAAHAGIGRVTDARGTVTGTLSGTPAGASAAAPLSVGDDLTLGLRVETGDASLAVMSLDPNGVLRLGQRTSATLDQAQIDAANGRSQSSLSLFLGKIEVVLGKLFRGDFTVETPVATLGVKGTIFRVLVEPSGRTTVAVLQGVVEVVAKGGGEKVELRAGEYTVIEPGREPESGLPPWPPAPFEPGDGTLSPGSGGPDFEVPGASGDGGLPPLLNPRGQFELPRNPPR